MKNKLPDLQNILFSMMEMLDDDQLDDLKKTSDEEFERKVKRALALNELARTAVQNGVLMVNAADKLYGLPVSDQLPLIPPSPAETPMLFDSKRKSLVPLPKDKK